MHIQDKAAALPLIIGLLVLLIISALMALLRTNPTVQRANHCTSLNWEQCSRTSGCDPVTGPSSCSSDGTICTSDLVYKGCIQLPVYSN